jgi:hypothetical protein
VLRLKKTLRMYYPTGIMAAYCQLDHLVDLRRSHAGADVLPWYKDMDGRFPGEPFLGFA